MMNTNKMSFVQKCLIIGLMIHVIDIADARDGGPKLINTLKDEEQNVGETCFDAIPFNCNASYKYRLMNGGCTNLENPDRGQALSVFTRLLPALYKDNHKEIRVQKSGKELESARVLSNEFCTEPKNSSEFFSGEFTLSMMQWAQTVTHDISGTAGKDGPRCCNADDTRMPQIPDNCEAINIPTKDDFYSQFKKTCISMPRTKSTDDVPCKVSPILPINFVTAYHDASLLYGSTHEADNEIRLFDKGMMKCQEINKSIFPPGVKDPKSVCRVDKNEDLCIQAGDNRANAHPMLAVIQTILLRLHNNIAFKFGELNGKVWDEETIFQEARRVVIAMLQHITYKFFLPNLLGDKYLHDINCCIVKDDGYNNIYDPSVNPQMLTEFSGCAFRALHSTIVDKIVMYQDDEKRTPTSEWTFSDFYLAIAFIAEKDNFEQLIVGMTTDLEGNLDRHFPTSITDKLFQVNGVGADMQSLDIEKGRDLGLNTYPKYLEMIGMPYPKSWEEYGTLIEPEMIERLKTKYESHEEVDLFIGGILEKDAEGSSLGPTFQAIIAEQFCRLQKGDRHYYELGDQVYPFKPEQLEQIRKVTLSLIYCYSSPKLKFMQPDAFRKVSDSNKVIPCPEIVGDFNLDAWKA